jgi:hypothetical protein
MSEERKPENLPPKKEVTPCSYPNCDCKNGAETSYDIVLDNEENANARMPFCFYHFAIVSSGEFTATYTKGETPEEDKFTLNGPFKEFQRIECVIAAIKLAENSQKTEKTQ